MTEKPVLISFGGGLNSTAMIIAMVELRCKIDEIVFSDTGCEKPDTYDNLQAVSNWLVSKGRNPITIVRKNETLEDYCTDRKMLPSLAYGFNQCSGDFKIKPIHNWVKSWPLAIQAWASGVKVQKCIGFDAGDRDMVRAKKFKEDYPGKYELRFPLIEMQITRDMCSSIIANSGLKIPPKSCCFFCPAHKKKEVVELAKNYPDLASRALALEANAQETLTSAKGLGRSFSWKSLLESESSQLRLFDDSETPRIACVCDV